MLSRSLLLSFTRSFSSSPSHRVALITGAANGIGFEIAKTLVRSSPIPHKVAIVDLNGTAAKAAAESLEKEGFSALGIQCDVTQECDVIRSVNETLSLFGQIDVLINNAGMQFIAPIEEFPSEKFEFLIRLMLIAPFQFTKLVFPGMKQRKFGRIINVASINGLVGFAGKSAYNSAKHGVIGFTKVAALEGAAHGITANALCPGYVGTQLVYNQLADLARTRKVPLEKVKEEVLWPLIPQKRLIEVQEIADYTEFLVSDKAKGITGQACVLDGGYVAQ
jgi:3-hydroxybutyrate dehydrogenase